MTVLKFWILFWLRKWHFVIKIKSYHSMLLEYNDVVLLNEIGSGDLNLLSSTFLRNSATRGLCTVGLVWLCSGRKTIIILKKLHQIKILLRSLPSYFVVNLFSFLKCKNSTYIQPEILDQKMTHVKSLFIIHHFAKKQFTGSIF